jgi:hypothetical protein
MRPRHGGLERLGVGVRILVLFLNYTEKTETQSAQRIAPLLSKAQKRGDLFLQLSVLCASAFSAFYKFFPRSTAAIALKGLFLGGLIGCC